MCYSSDVWTVLFHPEAEAEFDALPAKERVAVMHAVEKIKGLMTERHSVFDQVNELMGRVRQGDRG